MAFEESGFEGLALSSLRISDNTPRQRRGKSADCLNRKSSFPIQRTLSSATQSTAVPEDVIMTPKDDDAQLSVSQGFCKPTTHIPSPCPKMNSTTSHAGQSSSGRNLHMQLMRKLYVFPYFISGYIQLFFNLLIVSFCVYLLWCFYSTIRDDIETKVQLFSEEVVGQMTKCAKDFRENRCDPLERVPAMEQLCRSWEACMQQDPMVVATRAKFSAETLGEGLNAFFEKISWKTIICLSLLLFGLLVSYNIAFYFASRQQYRPVIDNRGPPMYFDGLQNAYPYHRAPPPVGALPDNSLGGGGCWGLNHSSSW